MATDGRNFLSELFKSAGQGLGTYAAGREQEQAESKQNALMAFTSALQMQEAARAAEEHRANMSKLAMSNRILELQEQEQIRLMSMRPEERAAETGASKTAMKIAELKSFVEANNVPIAPFSATGAGLTGAINQSGIFGPGMSGEIGGIQFQGPDPLADLKRQKIESEIDASNALAAQRTAKTGTGADKELSAKDQSVYDFYFAEYPEEEAQALWMEYATNESVTKDAKGIFTRALGEAGMVGAKPQDYAEAARISGYDPIQKTTQGDVLREIARKRKAGEITEDQAKDQVEKTKMYFENLDYYILQYMSKDPEALR